MPLSANVAQVDCSICRQVRVGIDGAFFEYGCGHGGPDSYPTCVECTTSLGGGPVYACPYCRADISFDVAEAHYAQTNFGEYTAGAMYTPAAADTDNAALQQPDVQQFIAEVNGLPLPPPEVPGGDPAPGGGGEPGPDGPDGSAGGGGEVGPDG